MRFVAVIILGLLLNVSMGWASLKDLNDQAPPFKLAPLPYPANSLEKAIDAQTMMVHHDKHHQSYIDKANKALENKKTSMIEILKTASSQSAEIRNNVGGHWNHTFFWSVLSGKAEDNKMPDGLKKDIETKWGSMAKFQEEFEKAGASQFGSGWAWLIRTPAGLEIVATANQDNPLMDVSPKRGWPILGADVWEHAYYLKYQNKRADYLKNFWKVVNWKMVDQYYQEIAKSQLP